LKYRKLRNAATNQGIKDRTLYNEERIEKQQTKRKFGK
jgi:hypothetical protein